MKTLKSIPKSQRHHFMKCECAQYIDMRNINEVMEHLHKSKSRKVEIITTNENGYAASLSVTSNSKI